MKATLLIDGLPGFSGEASLYALDEPLDGHSHVVVSATLAPFSGPETYIFGADDKGEITEWGELDGSYRGLSHATALQRAGYELVKVAA